MSSCFRFCFILSARNVIKQQQVINFTASVSELSVFGDASSRPNVIIPISDGTVRFNKRL